MILKIFTVFDSKAGVYGQPSFMVSRGAAIRSFTDMVNDQNHPFHKHPEDYTLFEIGEYDDNEGEIESSAPVSLGVALAYSNKIDVPMPIANGQKNKGDENPKLVTA